MKIDKYSKQIWEKLPKNTTDSYKGIQLTLDKNKLNVFFWQDENEIKHLMIESPFGRFDVPELRGLDFSFNSININHTGLKCYLDLVCSHEAFIENFTILTKLILHRIDFPNCNVEEEIINEINIWRLFLEKPYEGLLDKNDQLGIIGELILLKKIAEINPTKSLSLWRADQGEIDFISDNNLIEVKATAVAGHTHTINGIDQLKLVPKTNLFILSFSFADCDDTNEYNLSDCIEELRNYYKDSPILLKDYFVKLRNKKFHYSDIDKYKEHQFKLLDSKLFPIVEETPKLTSDQLKHPLSVKISKVRYTLELEGLYSTDIDKIDIYKLFDL
jgi:hypothetical protein